MNQSIQTRLQILLHIVNMHLFISDMLTLNREKLEALASFTLIHRLVFL